MLNKNKIRYSQTESDKINLDSIIEIGLDNWELN